MQSKLEPMKKVATSLRRHRQSIPRLAGGPHREAWGAADAAVEVGAQAVQKGDVAISLGLTWMSDAT